MTHFRLGTGKIYGPISSYACVDDVIISCIFYWIQAVSSVGIATDCEMDGRGSTPGTGKRFLSSPQRPDRLWGPPNPLSNGYRGAISPGVKRQGSKADHSSQSRSRVMELYLHSPMRLHGVMLN
jgi:hypothetical protein